MSTKGTTDAKKRVAVQKAKPRKAGTRKASTANRASIKTVQKADARVRAGSKRTSRPQSKSGVNRRNANPRRNQPKTQRVQGQSGNLDFIVNDSKITTAQWWIITFFAALFTALGFVLGILLHDN